MWNFLIGPLLALLPRRWRARLAPAAPVNWPVAGLVSGIAEGIGCLAGLIAWYFHEIGWLGGAFLDSAIRAAPGTEITDKQVAASALMVFAIHPVTWALSYFTFEGAWRGLAAALADESPASLPLVIIEWAMTYTKRKRELARTPLVRDEVTRGDGSQGWDLKVASCRAKLFWRPGLAIRYNEEFFEVTGASHADATPGQPHVYLLRRAHPRQALRGLENYDPEDVLHSEGAGFFGIVAREFRERWYAWRAPVAPDEVRHTIGHEGAGIVVHSCRPKPDWVHGRLVRYEDGYYRVEASRTDVPPRPFVFELKRIQAGVPGRSVHFYSPDEVLQRVK